MNAAILGLLAETPIHPGSGRGMGVVDLPVAREAATDFPVIVGSSLKGSLRDAVTTKDGIDAAAGRFGKEDNAGDLLVSDARLLLLPVRSLTSSYKWATCPLIIERYGRDLARAGLGSGPAVPKVQEGEVLAQGDVGEQLFLEERLFTIIGEAHDLSNSIRSIILHDDTRGRLAAQIAVLHDNDFAWFARYGLSIQARNALDKEGAKQSKALWYEESLPPDTVMYALVTARGAGTDGMATLHNLFTEGNSYLQVGGNETVGQGWFAVRVLKNDNGAA